MDSIVNKHSFGKKVKEAREKMGLTQAGLSELVGISPNFLGDIERGLKLPSIDTLLRLSNILKTSLDRLFVDSLNNILLEESLPKYTDKQLAILNNLVKSISENFEK